MSLTVAASAQSTLPASGNVSMTLEEYNKLAELAAKPRKAADALPSPYAIKSAEIRLRADGDAVSGTILLEGEVFSKGYQKVRLVTGMVILDAQLKGQELPVLQESDQEIALLPGPGDFAVALQTGWPLNTQPGRAWFSLPALAGGVVRLTLTVPGDHTPVDLNHGLITGRTFATDRTTIEATLEPGFVANISWPARVNAAPPAPPKATRFLSDIKSLISVSEAELAVVALAEVTVMQGEPSQFEVQPPPGYEITAVTGSTLASSEKSMDPKSTNLLLRVTPARSHQFLISLRQINTTAKAEVPLLTFTGTQRETGEVLIDGEGAMELTASERGGLHRMDIR
jgi:hypothetical protein